MWHNTVPEPDLAAQEVNKGFQVPAHSTVLVCLLDVLCVVHAMIVDKMCNWPSQVV